MWFVFLCLACSWSAVISHKTSTLSCSFRSTFSAVADVHSVSYGPIWSKVGNKAGFALGRGYVVIKKSLSQRVLRFSVGYPPELHPLVQVTSGSKWPRSWRPWCQTRPLAFDPTPPDAPWTGWWFFTDFGSDGFIRMSFWPLHQKLLHSSMLLSRVYRMHPGCSNKRVV